MKDFSETSQKERTPLFSPDQALRILSELVAHYRDEGPKEVCGVITDLGEVIRFRNWARRPDRFMTLGLRLIRRESWDAWRSGFGISHFYHSHPLRAGTSPSQTDKVFMAVLAARWPHVDHLIFKPDGSYSVWHYETGK